VDAKSALNPSAAGYLSDRPCLRHPIPELFAVAAELDLAVGAHLAGDRDRAAASFKATNTQAVRDYVEAMWGKRSLWPEQVHYLRHRTVDSLPKPTPDARGQKVSAATKRAVVQRDGFRCRYCSLCVIPHTVRKSLSQDYPTEVPWGATNASQHAAFQALWLQYDHVVPLSGGGANDPSNVVVTCAACNFMKWDYHLEELGLMDPRTRPPVTSCWDGLTRLFGGPEKCPL
jgi:5-methylcytosine-specific restriction endonuclease McrA